MAKKRRIDYQALEGRVDLPRGHELPHEILSKTLDRTNEVFVDLTSVAPYVYELLGMRNLSAFVGAAFARELQDCSKDLLLLNPHQDGYPDLLLMDKFGLSELKKIGRDNRSKQPFSPFPGGGLEIKATCGDVPSAKELVKQGKNKPLIGEERIDIVTNFNWKAHHRETNNLMGILWDFIDGIPAITAVTYSSKLEESDWGRIVQPREGGGRTTSVSIMAKSGIRKMLSNAIFVVQDQRYVEKIHRIANSR